MTKLTALWSSTGSAPNRSNESVMGGTPDGRALGRGRQWPPHSPERLCGQAGGCGPAVFLPPWPSSGWGERSEDLSYERGACKRCEMIGISVKHFILPVNCTQEELLTVIRRINEDGAIHGCLPFPSSAQTLGRGGGVCRPLPRQGCGWHHQRFPGQCILR